LHGLDWSRTS
jgi:hypothetical protein